MPKALKTIWDLGSEVGDDVLDWLKKKSGDTQVATTGGSYQKAGSLLEANGITDNVLDYGAGRGHGTQYLPGNAKSYEPNPMEGYTPDFTSSPDQTFDGIANLNVLNVVPEPLREEIAQDILGKLNKDGVAAIGARSYSDVMNAKNPTLLDDGGIITQKGTYQYGFGGENEGLVDYLKRQTDAFPDREYEVSPAKLAATGALVKRINGILAPGVVGLAAAGASDDSEAGILKVIAGKTVKELVEMGYPKEVAVKIHSGELPMDEASREARAQLMNMVDDRLHRGHFIGRPPHSDEDMFMSDSYDNAFTYADAYSTGEVTPLRHNARNLAYVNAAGKHDRTVTTNNIKNPGIRRGIIKGTDEIAEAVKYSDEYQGTHFKDIRDDMHNSSSTERANVYNILGSRPDVQIRHADLAAFDPDYKGSNIMGNATVPMLGTTAALSGAALLAPHIKDSGFISSPRSEGLFDFTMGARDLERRLEGSPASLLFPSGFIDYLETVNRREEDPNWVTRAMALADFL